MSIGQVNEEELEQRLGLVEIARSWSPRVISKLENAIRSYQDDDLYRFNPVRYAIQTGMGKKRSNRPFSACDAFWPLQHGVAACLRRLRPFGRKPAARRQFAFSLRLQPLLFRERSHAG
jgi:hypothetical protein